ncbi:MAG: flagellar protein FlgN [Proteobacteria bacterium]|nr:flagellar protein FlgN [Pseudomonadota bacterium]MBU1742231.1 flagellar protein FlgN [Pseudomonadota bacterium]
MDSRLIRELTRTLDEEISLYKVLLAVVQKERECLRQAAHQQLLDSVTLIEKNVRAIHEVKTQRRRVMDQIAEATGLNGEGGDLEAVIGVLPAEVASGVAGMRNQLESLIRHLSRLNEENVTFVSDALDFYAELTDTLVGASAGQAPGYPDAPTPASRRGASLLVSREV